MKYFYGKYILSSLSSCKYFWVDFFLIHLSGKKLAQSVDKAFSVSSAIYEITNLDYSVQVVMKHGRDH